MTRVQIRIGELAQLCGVNTRTVDYYTRLGLIDAVSRTGGNYRLYEPAAVERLTAIKRLQAQRYSLNEIREQLAGRSSGSSVATIEEIRGELEAIERKLRSVEGAFDAAAAHP
ncbi:MAG: MerR family transcriptional regulator, partial [Chloroflexia bacterium]